MTDITMWKLGTDILMVFGLVFLAIRFSRSSGARLQMRTEELQMGLKMLIRESEEAGNALNEKLLKRQSQLEQLLGDLESVEARISRAAQEGDQVIGKINEVVKEARLETTSIKVELQSAQQVRGQARSANAAASRPAAPARAAAVQFVDEEDEQSSQDEQEYINATQAAEEEYFQAPRASQDVPARARLEREAELTPEPPSFRLSAKTQAQPAARNAARSTNIYGEPIQTETRSQGYRPLSQSVEKHSRKPGAPALSEIQDVYERAEDLLRSGGNLNSVASRTDLPTEEVRALSRLIDDVPEDAVKVSIGKQSSGLGQDERQSPVFEPTEVEHSNSDSRLGVLGGMRRQRQTL